MQALLVFALSLMTASVELVGVTSIVPFMALACNPQLVHSSGPLQQVYSWLGFAQPRTFLMALGLAVLGMLTMSNLLQIWLAWFATHITNRQQQRLSLALLQDYLERPYPWYVQQNSLDLVNRLGEARQIADLNFKPCFMIVSRLWSVLLLVLVMVYFHPLATVFGFGFLLLLYTQVQNRYRPRLQHAYSQEWLLKNSMGQTLAEPLAGLKHIRLNGGERYFQRRYETQLQELGQLQLMRLWALEVPALTIHTLTYAAILGLVVYLVFLYGEGDNVVSQAALFALAGYRLIPSLRVLFWQFGQLEAGLAPFHALYDDLLLSLDRAQKPRVQLPRLVMTSSIALENVSFSYLQNDQSLPIFSALNLTIPRLACVGFVGPTGKGKTTLVHLLIGLLEAQQGRLLVDGQPLAREQLRAYQNGIGYVPQDNFLQDGTILQNIAFGHDPADIDREQAMRAAALAQLEEFVGQLPDGYETQVGERGIRLSGGQRQRIGIARALYGDPEILVFDEATSALDEGTETYVMSAIQSLARTKTILIVAHRLTTVKACDVIYYLDESGIQACGSYAELVEHSSQFRALAATLA
jgi:ABC-type bacteriocin/lantibiotic exporter with double-glycine peptidase domain